MKNDIQLSKHLTSSSALTLSHSNKLDDLRLTEHFKLSEFTRSATASARKIDNTPSEEVISNLQALCQNVLEPLREYFNCPIIIGSGFRSPALNKAVGGVKNSQHQYGEAADIHIPDEATGKRWFVWLMDNVPFHQLIWEKSTPSSTHHWIHVAFKRNGTNKQQVIQNLVKHHKA